MASPLLFIAGGITPDPNVGPIQTFIEMDSTVSLETRFAGNLTTHPVETGTRIADHLTRENPRFRVSGVTSNTPVRLRDLNSILPTGKRTKNVYDILKQMYETGHFFTLVADLESYENCVITNFGFTQTVDKAEAVYLDIDIEKIRVATPERVFSQLAVDAQYADDSAKKTDAGTKTGRDADTGPESHFIQILQGDR
jgi:hypothetical protein